MPVFFDTRWGRPAAYGHRTNKSSRECRFRLGLLGLPISMSIDAAWRASKQVGAGLEGGGVLGMCGRHSKDQCTPVETEGA